jgi:hypothetical protein
VSTSELLAKLQINHGGSVNVLHHLTIITLQNIQEQAMISHLG